MNLLRLVVISLTRRYPTTLPAVFLTALAILASGLALDVMAANQSRVAELRSDYDAVVGPKENGLAMVLEALELWRPSEDSIPYAMVESIHERVEADHILPLHIVARHRGAYVIGVDPEYLNRPVGISAPRMVDGVWFNGPGDAVVGAQAAARLGLRVGDSLTVRTSPSKERAEIARARWPLEIDLSRYDAVDQAFDEPTGKALWERDFRVAGIVEHGGGALDGSIFIDREVSFTRHSAFAREGITRPVSARGASTYLLVKLKNPDQWTPLYNAVHIGSTIQVAHIETELARLRGFVATAQKALAGMALGLLLLISVGVAVFLSARFDMLRPNIGLMSALGYTRGYILRWLALEGGLIVLAGIVVAVIVQWLLVSVAALPTLLDESVRPAAWPTGFNVLIWAGALAMAPLTTLIPLLRLRGARTHKMLSGM